MLRTEYVTPWVRLRAREESIRKEATYCSRLEPFAARHSITYFNNGKEDSKESAYERLHNIESYDPSKPRCDRTKQKLVWLEIYEENRSHKVPMTSNHWYGRPNRVQVDYPQKKFNRSSKMRDFYNRNDLSLITDGNGQKIKVC